MTKRVGIGLCVALLGVGCGVGARSARRVDPCDFQTVAFGRFAGRTYRVCDEQSFTSARRPLVIGLHGGTSNAAQMILLSGGERMNELATSEGFISVYANGSCVDASNNFDCDAEDRFVWNDCRADSTRTASGDDVGYLRALITTVLPAAGVRFDPDRVYVWGHSNGAFMALRAAEELSDLVAGVASVSGNEAAVSECSTPAPARTRVLLMHGTEDPFVPDGGGAVGTGELSDGGTVLSTQETLDRWLGRNLCPRAPTSGPTLLPDLDESDGPRGTSSRVERTLYESCANDADVALYRILGGGHPVPGTGRSGGFCVNDPVSGGCTNEDIQAADEIWRFFDG